MPLDIVGVILILLFCAVAVGVPAVWYLRAPGGRWLLTAHILWFVTVALLAVTGALSSRPDLGAPVFGLAIAASIAVLLALAGAVPPARRALGTIPLPALIALNVIRVGGFLFLLLFAAGRLSAPFAPSAGWGDIITGVAAPPVAWALAGGARHARGLVLAWNSFGLLDLLVASSLGMTSALGSPLQLFFQSPGSAAMATWPWALIPAFLVPQLIVQHLAVYWRLPLRRDRAAVATPAPIQS